MQTGPHITRQKLIILLVVLLWVSLAVRIGIIQVLNHNQWRETAQKQRKKTVTVKGARGGILTVTVCNWP